MLCIVFQVAKSGREIGQGIRGSIDKVEDVELIDLIVVVVKVGNVVIVQKERFTVACLIAWLGQCFSRVGFDI